MNILIDTNVALDSLLERQPFCAAASRVLSLSTLGVGIFVSASAITDMYYISRKHMGSKKAAMELLKRLLLNAGAATVSDAEIRRAIALDWGDFEDAVQYAAGERLAVDYIVTRNGADFTAAALPVVTPEDFLSLVVSA
ncbi:PIN domain-containing protein [Treponema primitia]|uniref:PIN domain-containing protein n=1 Tax=Treponema primitia TaxID=88058 RepID=UPI0002554D1C|nr:PIN domain-containing protein [Treponema primitia]